MRTLFAALLILITMTSCFGGSRSRHLEQAEENSRRGNFDEAIDEYREHMESRLDTKDRPKWENPYFYLILIGDIQLGQGKVQDALESYEEAMRKGVDMYLVSDRIRSVARWYEQHDQLEEAIKLLTKHRDSDDLLFDAMLDRVSKELVRREDAARLGEAPLPQTQETPAPETNSL